MINGYKIIDALLFMIGLEYDEYLYLSSRPELDQSLVFELFLDGEHKLLDLKSSY